MSSLATTFPVPLKSKLEQFKDLFDGGASIETALNDDTEVDGDDDTSEDDVEENIHENGDDGIDDLDFELMNSLD